MINALILATCATFNVTPMPFEVAVDNTMSVRQITERFYKDDGVMFGAIVATFDVKVEGCTIQMGYTNVTKYVAKDLRQGCEHDHVDTHENGHLDIYRQALSFAPVSVESSGVIDYINKFYTDTRALQNGHDGHVAEENLYACGRKLRRFL